MFDVTNCDRSQGKSESFMSPPVHEQVGEFGEKHVCKAASVLHIFLF